MTMKTITVTRRRDRAPTPFRPPATGAAAAPRPGPPGQPELRRGRSGHAARRRRPAAAPLDCCCSIVASPSCDKSVTNATADYNTDAQCDKPSKVVGRTTLTTLAKIDAPWQWQFFQVKFKVWDKSRPVGRGALGEVHTRNK